MEKKLLIIKEEKEKRDAQIYVRSIQKESVRRNVEVNIFSKNTTDMNFIEWSYRLKELIAEVDGVIVANPFDSFFGGIVKKALMRDLLKDLDNYTGASMYPNCTLEAILQLMRRDNINISGKKVVVLGRHLGGIIADEMTNMDATVTKCHSKTVDVAGETKRADIVISCVGKKVLTPDMIGSHTIVFDIGYDTTGEFDKLYTYSEIGKMNTENIFNHMEGIKR